MGSILLLLIGLASMVIQRKLKLAVFNHLSLALIPLGGGSVFVGLVALTVTMLQKYADLGFMWINDFKGTVLALATLWSLCLAYQIIRQYTASWLRRLLALTLLGLCCSVVNYSWFLVLHVWAVKSDSVPWNTLWLAF